MDIQSKVIIYGAQMVGVSIYYAIKNIMPATEICSFVVSKCGDNPCDIDGVPVVELDDYDYSGEQILVATPQNHHANIVMELEKRNMSNYLLIDSITEAVLLKQYYDTMKMFPSLCDLSQFADKATLAVYMSKFYKDQPLKEEAEIHPWLHSIQAGADLTDVRVAEVYDNAGDNISAKNPNYCELTALYWIWKHVKNEYKGLFHYRRQLVIRDEDLYKMGNGQVDVVLPYPSIHYPTITEQHKRYIQEKDWKVLWEVIEDLYPQYAVILPQLFQQPYFYNFNMLVAREEIFDDFCEWMFSILQRVEELSTPRGNERADRYTAYMGETLTTIYFMYHKDDYKIYHTGRIMLT